LSEDELRRPINRHEEVELALLSANLGNVEVEVADRVALEGFLSGLVTGDLRQTADRVAFKAPMQRRPGQMRDRRLQGIWLALLLDRQQHADLFAHSTRRPAVKGRPLNRALHGMQKNSLVESRSRRLAPAATRDALAALRWGDDGA
jgi:hypothetical protein